MEFYLFLSSEDSYRGNAQHFRIQTNRQQLEGEWFVSLAELYVDNAIMTETLACTRKTYTETCV